MLARMWIKGTLTHCCGNVILFSHWEQLYVSFSKNLKIELLYNSATPLLSIYLKKNKNTKSKGYMHPYIHNSIIFHCQDRNLRWQPKRPSTDEWIKKILFNHKKRKFAICSIMDRLGQHYVTWNKSESEYSITSLICGT